MAQRMKFLKVANGNGIYSVFEKIWPYPGWDLSLACVPEQEADAFVEKNLNY